jgi:hypothetical protein
MFIYCRPTKLYRAVVGLWRNTRCSILWRRYCIKLYSVQSRGDFTCSWSKVSPFFLQNCRSRLRRRMKSLATSPSCTNKRNNWPRWSGFYFIWDMQITCNQLLAGHWWKHRTPADSRHSRWLDSSMIFIARSCYIATTCCNWSRSKLMPIVSSTMTTW